MGDKDKGEELAWSPAHAREALKRKLFNLLDRDKDGFLDKAEMKELAKLVGFDDRYADWNDEYVKLCHEVKVSPEEGIARKVVMKLLDDESATGCYCSEEELQKLIQIVPGKTRERKSVAAAPPTATGDWYADSGIAKSSSWNAWTSKEGKTGKDVQHTKDSKMRGAATGDHETTKVFFTGAAALTSNNVLWDHFQKAGEVVEVNLLKMKDGRSRGMGYVTFCKPAEAQNAIAILNWHKVEGQVLALTAHNVSEEQDSWYDGWEKKGAGWEGYEDWSCLGTSYGGSKGSKKSSASASKGSTKLHEGEEGCTVYFIGAPVDVSANKLRGKFQECGKIENFWLFEFSGGRSRGQGLVQYSKPSDARRACEKLNNLMMEGQKIRVRIDKVGALEQQEEQQGWDNNEQGRWKKSGGSRGAHKKEGSSLPSSVCYKVFFNGSPSLSPVKTVQRAFNAYGETVGVNMFRHSDGQNKGMGIVTYRHARSALEAIKHGVEVDGWVLHVEEAYDNKNKDLELQEESWEPQQPSLKVDPRKTVSFSNVPTAITENYLWQRFEAAGSIKTLHIFTTKDGRSTGKGIVEFHTTGSVQRAYAMHGSKVSGKAMVVDEYDPY